MRISGKNRFIDLRFTGKKFLKAERMKMHEKNGDARDIPNQINCYIGRYVSSFITSMTYRCSL